MINSLRDHINALSNTRIIILLFIIIGGIIYINSLLNGFVLDDIGQLVENPKIYSIKNIFDFFTGGTVFTNYSDKLLGFYYKPLLLTTFTIITSISGNTNAIVLHLLQLILHISNSLMLFYLFRKFFNKNLALILSLIFLVHPINSESVLYISGIQDTLFMFFGLSALISYIYSKQTIYLRYLSPVLLLLSFLSKETGILFLIAIFFYIIIFEKKNRFIKTLPYLMSFVIYITMRFSVMGIKFTESKMSPISQLDFIERVTNIPSLIFFYVERLFIPIRLVSSYNEIIKELTFNNFVLPLGIISLIIGFLIFYGIYLFTFKKENKLIYLYFLILVVCGLLLHIQIIPLDMSASERWFYFPFIGLLGITGVMISNIKIKSRKIKDAIYISLIIILVILSIRTIMRTFDYRNNITITTHDLKITNSYFLYSHLGIEYIKIGDLEGGKNELEKSIELFPYSLNNYSNLCTVQINLGLEKKINH